MSSPEQAASSHDEPQAPLSPRSEFLSGIGWMVLGLAILIGSLRMDRLENQDINPYTIPGLLPGLLGIAMTILGGLLAMRSWRPHLFASAANDNTAPSDRAGRKRLALVIGLCLLFGVGLVGHGLPFWLASAIFVAVAILSLQYQPGKPAGESLGPRKLAKAIAIGLGAGVVITLIFQELFLVRLP